MKPYTIIPRMHFKLPGDLSECRTVCEYLLVWNIAMGIASMLWERTSMGVAFCALAGTSALVIFWIDLVDEERDAAKR